MTPLKRRSQIWHRNRTPRAGLHLLWVPFLANAPLFFLTLGLLLVVVGLGLVQAWGLRLVFDGLQSHHPAMIRQGTIGFAVALVFSGILMAITNYTRQVVGSAVMMNIRHRAMARLLAATLAFHDQYVVGDLTSRLATDAWAAYQLTAWDFLALISNPLMMLASAAYLWTLSPTLAFIIVPIGPLMLLVRLWWKRRLYDPRMQVQMIGAEMNHAILEIIQGLSQVKAYQMEPTIAQRYAGVLRRWLAASRRDYGAQAQFGWVTSWIGALPFLTVIVVGSVLAARGRFELGTLMAATQLMNRIVGPFSLVSEHIGHVQNGVASMDRIQVLMEAPKESLTAPSGPSPDAETPPEIVCHQVQFGYRDDVPVLRGLTLTLPPGTMTAVGGPNGGGKTTLAKLLLRFYLPTKGDITWNGQSLTTLGTRWIREHTAYVPQDMFLVDGSVAENLRLMSPGASEEDLLRVLAKVGLPDEVAFLNRPVGDAGREFSGGQRLRLAIARALLRDGPLWILDEPTAALDPDGVQSVTELVRQLAGSRTIVVITHSREMADVADHQWTVEAGLATPGWTWPAR